jgi:hypothetical protein
MAALSATVWTRPGRLGLGHPGGEELDLEDVHLQIGLDGPAGRGIKMHPGQAGRDVLQRRLRQRRSQRLIR